MKHLSPTLFLCLTVITLLLSPSPAAAETGPATRPACISTGWPQDGSDLAPDPNLVFGALDNGLRYVLMVNREPRNRVAMYLNVQAGSLHETEDQRGVAHFLEHMLFNGTSQYPPGTLIEYFQSIGMGFGADTNAHTGFDETVYNLLLPSGEPAVMAEGMKVLADYARGALLLEAEVERERGIILAEKRSRDSAESRVSKRQLQFDFAGALVAERDPIGTEEVLKAADSRLLRTYYDRWYRPENMVVVVVGDMDRAEAERQIRQSFAGLKTPEATIVCPDPGRVKDTGTDILLLPEPELGYTGLTLTTVFNTEPRRDSLGWQQEQFRRYVAMSLFNTRLRQLEQEADSPLTKSRAMGGVFLQRHGYAALAARTEAGRWRQAMALLQTTLAQALRDGFSEQELQRGREEIQAQLEKAVQTAASRDSREIAQDIIRKLNDNEVLLSPSQDMAIFGPMLARMTVAEVNEALQQLWASPRRQVQVVGVVEPSLVGGQGEEMVRQAFLAHAQQPVGRWVEAWRAPFPYLPAPERAAEVVERVEHQEIGVATTVFQGGVRLNCKRTDFQANQVLMSIQFGRGRQEEPAAGIGLVAESVLRESGVGGLTKEQLDAALAGTNVNLEFRVGGESFSLAGSSLAGELELLLQLARTRLRDPAFRPEAMTRVRELLQQMYAQMDSSVEGAMQLGGEQFLGGGGVEYGLPGWDALSRIELAQVEGWLRPILAGAELEINLVGDIDPQEAARLVGRYFGGEQRQPLAQAESQALVFPAGQERQLTVPSSIDKTLLTVAWRTSDFWEIGRTRRLNLLAAVLDDRLRVKIREELGATYSPRVFSQPSRIRPDFGLLQGRLTVAPEQAAALARVIKQTGANLGDKGVSQDELRRALEPTLTSIRDARRTNRYWLEAVMNLSSRHPLQLQWPLTIETDFAAIKAEELTALAARYLRAEQAAVVTISPAAKP